MFKKINTTPSELTAQNKRIYKKFLKETKKSIEIKIQQFNIDFKNLFFVPWKWKIQIPFTIYIRDTRSHIEDKIMENPEFAEILKNRMLLQHEQYKVKYVKMINMIKDKLSKEDYGDIMFVTFKKRYFNPYLSWHAPTQKFVEIVTEVYDIFYFENDKLPWIKLDCHYLFDTEKYLIRFMNEWAECFIDSNGLNIKDFFIRWNYIFPVIITMFQGERLRQQILDMIAFKLVQSRPNYWKDLCTRLMGKQDAVFLQFRKYIELSWVDNFVLRFNFPFLGGQAIKIFNKNSKKIRMSRFKSLFFNVKRKSFSKKNKKKKKTKKDHELGIKKTLLSSKYGAKGRVKKVLR